jgi:hypothetical protein
MSKTTVDTSPAQPTPRAARGRRWLQAALGVTFAAVTAIVLKAYVPIGSARAESPGTSIAQGSVSAGLSAPVSQERSFTTLREAMRDGLSPAFGEVSIYAFHGMEMDEEAFTSVIASAKALGQAAKEVPLLAKRNFTAEERAFFMELATRLGEDTSSLSVAADRRDAAEISRLMNRIDTTCQGCHARLAPHLSQSRE